MKILNKLTIKHLTMNKKRTIVTIIGVLLSTALMVGIGLLFASLRDNTIKTTIASKGAQHATIHEVLGSKTSILENNIGIRKVSYTEKIGFSALEGGENPYKPYLLVVEGSKDLLDTLELIEGRLPQNEKEIVIPSHIKTNAGLAYKVGDTLSLDLGYRNVEGEKTLSTKEFTDGETLESKEKREYKVVGMIERSYLEPYSSPGYMVFSKLGTPSKNAHLTAYIEYKQVKDIYNKTEAIGKNLGLSNIDIENNIEYNDSLLSAYGISRYSNIMNSMMGLVIIVLSLISIGCIIVIYNSFAISVMERKKQFGLFSSIGATKKQIRHTVFFEAFIIGMIGIPLGILSAFIGIGTVLMIVNNMLPDVFQFPLALSIYPTFLIVPVFFMIIVILLSAFLPAHKASKITPIEAIRQNDDIKIRGKKLKMNPLVKKIFGVEGEIALKNSKRNKKKYRITVVSLFISIVLFISFSSLMEYGLSSTGELFVNPNYDLMVNVDTEDMSKVESLYNTLKENEETKDISKIDSVFVNIEKLDSYYTKDAKEAMESDTSYRVEDGKDAPISGLSVVTLDDTAYQKFLKDIHSTEEVPVILNQTRSTIYKDNTRKVKTFEIFENKKDSLDLYAYEDSDEDGNGSYEKVYTLKNVKYTNIEPLGTEYTSYVSSPVIIVNQKQFEEIKKVTRFVGTGNHEIFVKAPEYKNLNKYLGELGKKNDFAHYYYSNITEDMKLQKNMIFVIGLLLYGFITLVTLIGVTSVFNTIHTSIALRRKEFAMLRSMGLTPNGFNKILYFESVFFGVKSLLYAIPVSLLISYFIGKQVEGIVSGGAFLIPYKSILIAIIGVFIIVFISMMYASSKIKKENILEAIREENI